jgi:major vault protein
MLGPDEQFTLLNLSGSTPKRPNVIRAICLLLGPDFSTDIVEIKTADHARLSVKLSYNWYFDTKNKDEKEASKLFNVPDFVGGKFCSWPTSMMSRLIVICFQDTCKAIASRVRGAVAAVAFDDFHKVCQAPL